MFQDSYSSIFKIKHKLFHGQPSNPNEKSFVLTYLATESQI
jgi:hypothetical protein